VEKSSERLLETSQTPPSHAAGSGDLEEISCFLNRDVARNVGTKPSKKKIECRSDGNEVFLPFSFLEKHFEMKGEMVGDQEFEISESYGKVFTPSSKYSASGSFMHFENFKVEIRSRVRCVSAATGVPLSTQWDPSGYYYPTQIAQFALAHYSNYHNHFRDEEMERVVLDNGEDVLLNLKNPSKRVQDPDSNNALVIEFNTEEDLEIEIPKVHSKTDAKNLVVCLDLKNLAGASLRIDVEVLGDESNLKEVSLQYSFNERDHLVVKEDEVVYGMGSAPTGQWIRMTRDILTDLDKGGLLQGAKKRARLKVTRIVLTGHGQVQNVWLSEQEHLRQFLDAADWFMDNQDDNGGWPSQVTFNRGSKKYPGAGEVAPGWYGAMCQGQAISVLVRAHLSTGDSSYLEAATRAAKIFGKSTSEEGVAATVLGHVWYQEYPTHPASHILNGFMYGLLGLWDLASVKGFNQKSIANDLYRKGMESLLTLLPLFDSGSGTFYDLRHLTMHTAPKIARWDYHATHINQLLTLATVEEKEAAQMLRSTAERWRGYMAGQRASHN